MKNEYEADNGSRENVSEAKESSWPLGTIVRDVLAGFGAALVLLLAVGVGCEFALSRLDWRFDSIDRRFNQQDRRFDQQDSRFDWESYRKVSKPQKTSDSGEAACSSVMSRFSCASR